MRRLVSELKACLNVLLLLLKVSWLLLKSLQLNLRHCRLTIRNKIYLEYLSEFFRSSAIAFLALIFMNGISFTRIFSLMILLFFAIISKVVTVEAMIEEEEL